MPLTALQQWRSSTRGQEADRVRPATLRGPLLRALARRKERPCLNFSASPRARCATPLYIHPQTACSRPADCESYGAWPNASSLPALPVPVPRADRVRLVHALLGAVRRDVGELEREVRVVHGLRHEVRGRVELAHEAPAGSDLREPHLRAESRIVKAHRLPAVLTRAKAGT